jgi:dTDP-4-dehydrorhamnose reductase
VKVLLLGGAGLLGSAFRASTPAGVSLDAPPRVMLDATHVDALERALASARPDWVVTCAAFTAVDAAEANAGEARRLNADAVGMLGRLAQAHGTRVLLPSTDYVFDGPRRTPWREADEPAPRSVYAQSKRDGELALIATGAQHLLVRTGWLYGPRGRSFPATMWARARARTPSRVVHDQVGAPTAADDLAAWCWALMARDVRGVLHAANAGATTWFEVAQRVYARAGWPEGVTPVSTAEFGAAAPRPAYSVLDCTRLDALLPGARRTWDAALDAYLDALTTETGT